MNSLIIDTSSIQSCVGAALGSQIVFERYHLGPVAHAEVIPTYVTEALAKLPRIDQVIVGMGPGSYVGLRVGIAFARAFVLGRGIKLVGVCSLDGIDVSESDYLITTDARRNEIFWAKYINGERVSGPGVSTTAELSSMPGKNYGVLSGQSLYPSAGKLLAAAQRDSITEPIYLRAPDTQSSEKSR